MHTLRWALCAVLVSPLALAAGRLSSSSSSGDLGLAPRPELARTIMLVPPHGAAAVVTAPEAAADRIRPRAAQLASASTAPLHTAPLHTAPLRAGVRGRTFTRSSPSAQLAVYRVSRAPAPTRRPTTRRPRPTPQPAPAPTPKQVPPTPVPPTPVPPTPVPPQPAPPQPVPAPPAPTEPQAVTPAPPPVVVAPAGAPAESAPAPTPADTRPGNGFGDGNHEHTGPPGQAKKQ